MDGRDLTAYIVEGPFSFNTVGTVSGTNDSHEEGQSSMVTSLSVPLT